MRRPVPTVRVFCPWCGEVERPKDALAAAARTPAQVYRAVRGLTDAELSRRPLPSEWSLHEIIAHLADAEVAFGLRVRTIFAEDSPLIQPFDETAWALRLACDRRDLHTLLRSFRAMRAASLDLLSRVTPSEWERIGRHPEFGALTLASVWGHVVDHDLSHLEQMAKTRSAVENKRPSGYRGKS